MVTIEKKSRGQGGTGRIFKIHPKSYSKTVGGTGGPEWGNNTSGVPSNVAHMLLDSNTFRPTPVGVSQSRRVKGCSCPESDDNEAAVAAAATVCAGVVAASTTGGFSFPCSLITTLGLLADQIKLLVDQTKLDS